MKIRIATRKSALALWQANHIAELLEQLPEVSTTELVPLSTRGDEILDRSLQKIGGKGLFIKELELAMHDDRADLAVHSMKDVPAVMPTGFCIAATLPRANHADALICRDGLTLDTLPDGAMVGSSSLRRQAQLKTLRPDIHVKPLRGNVNTRLEKLARGDYDAIILAAAGLERLGLAQHISQQFTPQQMLPAAAQGVLGLECLENKRAIVTLLTKLNDQKSARTCAAERSIARVLDASCQSPVAAFATINDSGDEDELSLTALVAHPNGKTAIKLSHSGLAIDAGEIGESLAGQLLRHGARELLDEILDEQESLNE